MEKEVLDKLDVEGRRIYKKTGVPMGATDIPDVAEKLRRKDKGNPGKPPREWYKKEFDRLTKDGWVPEQADKMIKTKWHKKMNDAQRKNIIEKYITAKELKEAMGSDDTLKNTKELLAQYKREPPKEEYHSEKTNPEDETPKTEPLPLDLKRIGLEIEKAKEILKKYKQYDR